MNNELRIMKDGKKRFIHYSSFISHHSKGFTLIEALVSLTIIGIVGFILADLMSRSFQGSAKTALLGVIKQNGQTAMNIIDSKIRSAENVLCLNTDVIVVQNGESRLIRFYFEPPTGASAGYIAQDTLTRDPDPAYSSARYCNFLDHIRAPQKLTDTTKVSVTNGVFSKSSVEGFSDSVTISYKVKSATVGSGFSDQLGTSDGILFQTTINLR